MNDMDSKNTADCKDIDCIGFFCLTCFAALVNRMLGEWNKNVSNENGIDAQS